MITCLLWLLLNRLGTGHDDEAPYEKAKGKYYKGEVFEQFEIFLRKDVDKSEQFEIVSWKDVDKNEQKFEDYGHGGDVPTLSEADSA